MVSYDATGGYGAWISVQNTNAISMGAGGATKFFISNTQISALATLTMSNNKIIALAAGTNPTDAVNFSQLTDLSETGTLFFHANSTLSDSTAAGTNSVAIGPLATATGNNSIALGNGASAADNGSIALGQGSITAAVIPSPTATISGTTYTFAGGTPASVVSIGSSGSERKITNVAAGALKNTSTDAVNGSQLFAVTEQQGAASDALGQSAAQTFGAGTTYDPDTGTLSGFSQALNPVSATGASGATAAATSVGSALTALNTSLTNTAAIAVKYDAAGGNLITLGATGGAGAAAPITITNLAAGAVTDTSTDAVNGSQLYNVIYGGGLAIRYFHANSTEADSVATGLNSIAIGPAARSNSNMSVAVGDNATTTSQGSVSLGAETSDNGRGEESYTGKYSNISNNTSGTVSIGNSELGQTRTISNVADALNATDAVNLRQLDGAVEESKKYTDNSINELGDVINGNTADVDNLEQDINNIQAGKSGMFQVSSSSDNTPPTVSAVQSTAGGAGARATGKNSTAIGYKSKATHNNSVAIGANSVTDRDNSFSVGAQGNERQITNVAPATQDNDAVNLSQLNSTVNSFTNQATEYTNSKFKQLKQQIDDQDNVLSAGIASAMSMASMPQPYSAGSSITSLGVANYRGESAISIGVSHISENGAWITKVQLTGNTQNDTAAGIGVGMQW